MWWMVMVIDWLRLQSIEMKSKSKSNTNNPRDFMEIHNVQCNIKYVPQQKESRE